MGRRVGALAVAVGVALLLGGPVLAHEGEEGSGLSVEPTSFAAGDTVVLAGQGLEPDSERQINLVGPDVIVPFPNVTTDGDGMFAATLTIPGHLPPGAYRFEAIGDETLTVACAITAAAGVPPSQGDGASGDVVVPRGRSPLELAAWTGLILVVLLGGGVLVLRAERLGHFFERPEAP